MNASHVTETSCEVKMKYSTLLQVRGVNVELRIGVIDNWKVDCSDSIATDQTIDL